MQQCINNVNSEYFRKWMCSVGILSDATEALAKIQDIHDQPLQPFFVKPPKAQVDLQQFDLQALFH